MVRRYGLIAVVALSCGNPPGARPLSAGETPPAAASGIGSVRQAATGVLSYAIAIDELRMVSVELATEFDLVVRDLNESGGVTRTRRSRLGPPDYDIYDLCVAGRTAYVASLDGTVRGIDLETLESTVTWHLGDGATAVAITRDGTYAATGSRAGVVCLRRAKDGALLQCVAAHSGPVSALATSGDRLVSASWDGSVIVWAIPSLTVRSRYRVDGSANDVSLSPDRSRIAIAVSRSPPVRNPAVAQRERIVDYRAPDPGAFVEVVASGRKPMRLRGHGAPVTAVDWTPDNARIVSGSWDRTVRLWDSSTGKELDRSRALSHIVRDVVVHPNGRWVGVAAWAVSRDQPSSVLLELLYTVD